MGSTRIEPAIEELETDDDDFDPSCDDIRLAWLAHETAAEQTRTHNFESPWSDR